MNQKKQSPRAFLALSFAVYLMLGMYFTANQALIDRICQGFGAGTAAMGVMIGLFYIGITVSALIMGELSERTGKKATIAGGMLVIVVGVVIVGFSQSFAVACAGLFLSGIGFGTMESMTSSATADACPENPERGMNIAQAFFSAGAVASPLVIGAFIKAGGDWRTVYFATAALTLLLFFVTTRIEFGARPEHPEHIRGLVSLRLLKKPVFVLYLVLIFGYLGIESGVSFWVVSYFAEVSANAALGELSLSVFWLGTLVSRLLCSRVQNHRALMVAAFSLSAVCTALFVYLPSPSLKIAAVGLIAVALGPIWPVLFVSGSKQHPQHGSAAFGVMMLASSLGGAVIQPVIGKAVEGAPISAAYWAIAALGVLLALLMLVVNRAEGRAKSAAEFPG